MTDPIKRAGVGPVESGSGGVSETTGPRSEAFREALETERARGAEAVAPSAPSELSGLADELRAGRLTPEQVIDTLVQRQLASPAAAGLTPAARAQLEGVLRARLADDPTLASMGATLGRHVDTGAPDR